MQRLEVNTSRRSRASLPHTLSRGGLEVCNQGESAKHLIELAVISPIAIANILQLPSWSNSRASARASVRPTTWSPISRVGEPWLLQQGIWYNGQSESNGPQERMTQEISRSAKLFRQLVGALHGPHVSCPSGLATDNPMDVEDRGAPHHEPSP